VRIKYIFVLQIHFLFSRLEAAMRTPNSVVDLECLTIYRDFLKDDLSTTSVAYENLAPYSVLLQDLALAGHIRFIHPPKFFLKIFKNPYRGYFKRRDIDMFVVIYCDECSCWRQV